MEKIVPYYHKVIRFGWGETGRVSSMAAYRREETSTIELSHIQERKDGTMLLWLKSFGMVKWYIETNDVAGTVKKFDIHATKEIEIIKDSEFVH
jgi:hypothetical protein